MSKFNNIWVEFAYFMYLHKVHFETKTDKLILYHKHANVNWIELNV